MKLPRTLVIGIDGATFSVIKPWAAAGLLPTFAHLLKHGAHANLDAFPHFNSAAAWTNLVTGYNPGKHNIFSFTTREQSQAKVRPTSARDRRKPAFWHTFSASGQRVGVMNVPISFPSEKINGFMVSGMDTPDTNSKGFTAPEGLFQELGRAGIEYVIDVPNIRRAAQQNMNVVPPTVREMTLARTRSFLYLLEKYPCDAAMVVYIGSDRISHYFWRDTLPAPDAPEWKPLRDLFVLYDTQLQEILQYADNETTLFLLSDHGFGPARIGYRGVNTLLQRLGYQTQYARPSRTMFLGSLLQAGRRTVPQRWQRKLAERFPGMHSRALHSSRHGSFDWAQTRAYAEYHGSICINSQPRDPKGIVSNAEYETLYQELAEVMSELTDPETGRPIVSKIHHPDEFYSGPFISGGADLIIRWNLENPGDGLAYRKNGQNITVRPDRPSSGWVGTHYPDGIFIAYGKGIRPGIAHAPITHFDLAPTLLFLHDQPIAEDMDGRVLTEWFQAEIVSQHAIKKQGASDYAPEHATPDDGENEMIENRLRSLGYIE